MAAFQGYSVYTPGAPSAYRTGALKVPVSRMTASVAPGVALGRSVLSFHTGAGDSSGGSCMPMMPWASCGSPCSFFAHGVRCSSIALGVSCRRSSLGKDSLSHSRLGQIALPRKSVLGNSDSMKRSSVAVSCGLDEPAPGGGDLHMMELPCLPFIPAEVLVPASTKTLHLYEARYLVLLDEIMNKTGGLFGHVVLEPSATKAGEEEVSFVASRCCLTYVESVRKLEIGALISVRGICRLRLLALTQVEPFLKGSLMVEEDQTEMDGEKKEQLAGKVEGLKETLRDVQRLQIRVKTPGNSPFQTPLEEAVQWAEKSVSGRMPMLAASSTLSASAQASADGSISPPLPPAQDPSLPSWPANPAYLEGFLPSRAELLAFASLQPVTAATPSELHKLLQARLLAMSTADTSLRLEICTAYAEESRASLAAKLALQSLSSST